MRSQSNGKIESKSSDQRSPSLNREARYVFLAAVWHVKLQRLMCIWEAFYPGWLVIQIRVLPYLSQEEQLQGSEVYVVCDIIRLTTVWSCRSCFCDLVKVHEHLVLQVKGTGRKAEEKCIWANKCCEVICSKFPLPVVGTESVIVAFEDYLIPD